MESWLTKLKSLPPEEAIEPELKSHRQEHDKKIREEQDLAAGVVLQAVVEAGEAGPSPQSDDLVCVHVRVLAHESEEQLHSTRAEDGGPGQPLAFRLGKGWRAPRAWELALLDMKKGERRALKVQPSYGYRHPDCRMAPPPGVPTSAPLSFDLQLLGWVPGAGVRTLGEAEDVFKRTLVESESWETARAPNEVTLTCTARCLAYDGVPRSGRTYFATAEPLHVALGARQLPRGVELALSHMSKGEKALFVVPAQEMGGGAWEGAPLLPDPPTRAQQVELEVELVDLVQVRDMTGDGAVTKRRLRPGSGEFPVDCPVHDTTVTVHFRVRPAAAAASPAAAAVTPSRPAPSSGTAGGQAGSEGGGDGDGGWELPCEGWVYDTRRDSSLGGQPVVADTGCGELPSGLELAVKLMVPQEVALVRCAPEHAYQGRDDAPAGVAPSASVEFEVTLVGFEREGHWQVMEMEERLALAARMKGKANELYKAGKHAYAVARYQRLLRLLDSTRDFETQEEVEAVDGVKLAVLSNLVLAEHARGEYANAVSWANKALEMDPGSAKLVFRRAKALSAKGDHGEAEEDLARVLELDASAAPEVERERAANAARRRQAAAKQKQQFANFFSRSGGAAAGGGGGAGTTAAPPAGSGRKAS